MTTKTKTPSRRKPMQYRQGDVFITKADIPATAKKQTIEGRIILEHGEVTGHAHAIEQTEGVDLYLEGTRKFLELCFDREVTHEEHAPIPLAPGTYEVRRQRTWSALEQMSRLVAD